jgi:polyphosphate kinase
VSVAQIQVGGGAWREEIALPREERYVNRELSWLEFNARVLALAEDAKQPLMERVKFLAIFNRNLDEFFQIRVAGLKEQVGAGVWVTSPCGMTPRQQLDAISERVRTLTARQNRMFAKRIRPLLAEAGVRLEEWANLDKVARAHLRDTFERQVFPILTPLSVDPAHPFPYISNLSLNLAVVVRDPVTQLRRFARIKVPPIIPRFVPLPDGERFLPLEELIAAHAEMLFPGMEIVAIHPFRVTRDADIDVEVAEADDLLSTIEAVVQRRERSPQAVRLEVNRSMPKSVRSLLMEELRLIASDVYITKAMLGFDDLWQMTELDRPDLKAAPWKGVTQPRLAADDKGENDIFHALRDGDVLVQHPYDSFETSVAAFVDQASRDPGVLAIKQTIYRTSPKDSSIVRSLARAAESGKQTVALVELTARGDEERNIGWARLLERAGVHVVYGVVGLKTHTKISLAVRQEKNGVRRYCHVGTGNYDPETATIYEDIGLLTAEPEVAADVADLFNSLTGYSRQDHYRRLLVAPTMLRSRLLEMIRTEAEAKDGEIVLKMNALVDTEMIDALYLASSAGTSIDLLVRGICCLRPGVPKVSENIRVRSIVGRYLEHSRIFRFGSERRGRTYLIGSADLMPRNLDHRVECLVPVADPALQARVEEILRVDLSDDELAWELGPDGWSKVPVEAGINAQERLQEIALARAERGT